MIDYVTLKIIWWLLLGILLIGFAVTDGFDLGIGILLPYVARTDDERRIVLNTIGPVWEGNQIWLILGGGAIFAAWPMLYSVSFSGFYFAMLAILAALILRPVGFKYRSKFKSESIRRAWDWALFISGFVPALIFGVAVGNVIQGVPFHFDPFLRDFYTGTFFQLLNPFALLCGTLSVAMLITHGAIFLCLKTDGQIATRAKQIAEHTTLITTLLFAFGGFAILCHVQGYIAQGVMPAGPANPLHKTVHLQTGMWLNNFIFHHTLMIVPFLGILLPLVTLLLITLKQYTWAFVTSSGSIASIIATVGVSMFPFLLPSSSHPNMSLLVWDASSSQTTLFIMLVATIIFLPIILLYTSWVYYVMRGKVTERAIKANPKNYY